MATLVTNSFVTWELTDEEHKQGSMLTITQLQVLQNNIAMAAEEKLALVPDLTDQLAYFRAEARLAGYIEALKFIAEQSEFFRIALEEEARGGTPDY